MLKCLLNCFLKFEIVYNQINLKKDQVRKPDSSIASISNQSLDYIITDNLNFEVSNTIEDLNIGNLIPISCGHNGMFSYEETCIYESYLKAAKFIL